MDSIRPSAGVVFAALALAMNAASAQEAVFSNRAAFESALGGFRILSFEAEDGFPLAGSDVASLDGGRIEVISDIGDYHGPAAITNFPDQSNQVLIGKDTSGIAANSNVRLTFAEPQPAIGFDAFLPEPGVGMGTVTVTYGDNTIEQFNFLDQSGGPGEEFFGLTSTRGIGSFHFQASNLNDPNNPGEQPSRLDNLTVVPEPSSALVSLSLLVLAARRGGRGHIRNG